MFTVIDVKEVKIGDNVIIRTFNQFRGLTKLQIGNFVLIGGGINGSNIFVSGRADTNQKRMLKIGSGTLITLRHFFDVSDNIIIGNNVCFAGIETALFTHSGTDVNTKPITIGDYCYIGSHVKFAPGAAVPNYSVIGMGGVVTKKLSEERYLYVGVPVVPKKKVDMDWEVFDLSKSPGFRKDLGL